MIIADSTSPVLGGRSPIFALSFGIPPVLPLREVFLQLIAHKKHLMISFTRFYLPDLTREPNFDLNFTQISGWKGGKSPSLHFVMLLPCSFPPNITEGDSPSLHVSYVGASDDVVMRGA